jgi:hypothetical protein
MKGMAVKSSSIATVLSGLVLLGCSGTGQPEVTYPAYAVPEPSAMTTAGAWNVTFSDATIAFGPVYFCAAQSGSATLCETAVGDIRSITRVNLLDVEPQPLGEVDGFTGSIRSASYDYGIHWFLTENAPTPAPEAPGGHSAHFAGTASRGADRVHFTADIDLLPQFQGQRAVPSAPYLASVDEDGGRLDARMPLASWFADVDFDALFAAGKDPVVFEPNSQAYSAIVIAMIANAPPEFVFSTDDSVKRSEP